jgi:catalase-peroxidase
VVVQLLKKQQKRWSVIVPFTAGRADASQEQTDAESFDVLEPEADGFQYLKAEYTISSEEMLIDKAQLLTLTVPQMTVLLEIRVLTPTLISQTWRIYSASEVLTNDFFLNLLDMTTTWKSVSEADTIFEGHNRTTGG